VVRAVVHEEAIERPHAVWNSLLGVRRTALQRLQKLAAAS